MNGFWNKVTNARTIGIITVLVAIVAVIAQMIWDKYKDKTSIALQQINSITLVQNQSSLNKLRIYYDNKSINEITKISFRLVNDGNKAIIEGDVKKPITIHFENKAQVLDLTDAYSTPRNIDYHIQIDSTKHVIMLAFSLMNPKDEISFSLLLSGGSKYLADARIVGVRELSQEINNTKTTPFSWSDWLPVLICAFFSFMLLKTAVSIRSSCVLGSLFKEKYLDNVPDFPAFSSKEELIDFVTINMTFLTNQQRPLLKTITYLPEKLEVDYKYQIFRLVSEYFDNESLKTERYVIPFFAGLGFLICTVYIIWGRIF